MYICKQCKHTFKQSKKAQQIENKKKKKIINMTIICNHKKIELKSS